MLDLDQRVLLVARELRIADLGGNDSKDDLVAFKDFDDDDDEFGLGGGGGGGWGDDDDDY